MAYPFVVFEGIDGCGKGAQVAELEKFVKKRRERVFLHKFPSESAKEVRAHLSGKKSYEEDELFSIYLQDIISAQEKMKADMLKGWVIADRYCISTAAYQSDKMDLQKRMMQIEEKGLLRANIVFWLDLPVAQAMKRKLGQKLPDRFEADSPFQKKVRENYEKLYRTSFMGAKWERIDASLEQRKIAEIIRAKINL
ncbi:MAG: dTMP kinase [Candidatus Micrarchaeia archaeon]